MSVTSTDNELSWEDDEFYGDESYFEDGGGRGFQLGSKGPLDSLIEDIRRCIDKQTKVINFKLTKVGKYGRANI